MLTLKRDSAQINNLVAYMQQLLADCVDDQEFLEFARSIVASSPYESYDQFSTILEYVRSNVRYQPDPNDTELLTAPHRMMELVKQGIAAGDCDDVAIFCTAICRALGYEAHIVILDQSGTGWNHAAAEVGSHTLGERLYMDPTIPGRLGIASSRKHDEPGSRVHGVEITPHYRVKLEVP